MMSSVGAVVNHESDDEYNPIRMLKTSIASTVQVRYFQLLFHTPVFFKIVVEQHLKIRLCVEVPRSR